VESGEGIESNMDAGSRRTLCFLYVESGEGIESITEGPTTSRLSFCMWNPVKELKVIFMMKRDRDARWWNPVKELKDKLHTPRPWHHLFTSACGIR